MKNLILSMALILGFSSSMLSQAEIEFESDGLGAHLNLMQVSTADQYSRIWFTNDISTDIWSIRAGTADSGQSDFDFRYYDGSTTQSLLKLDGDADKSIFRSTIVVEQVDTLDNSARNVVLKTDGSVAVRHYEIGDYVYGGIVFWVDESGEHGLVCARADQSSGVRWSGSGYGETKATASGYYAGKMNTNVIIATQISEGDHSTNYAARAAFVFVPSAGEPYADWYLPSRYELDLLYVNRVAVNASLDSNGGIELNPSAYWSSTETGATAAWQRNFSTGASAGNLKTSTARVRAIRAF